MQVCDPISVCYLVNRVIPAKKKAKLLEKEAKLAAKVQKVAAATSAGEKKTKVTKEKKEAEPEFVNTTPPGQKKGSSLDFLPYTAF